MTVATGARVGQLRQGIARSNRSADSHYRRSDGHARDLGAVAPLGSGLLVREPWIGDAIRVPVVRGATPAPPRRTRATGSDR